MRLWVVPKSLINLCSSIGRKKGIKYHYEFVKGQPAYSSYIGQLLCSEYCLTLLFVYFVTLQYGFNKLIFKMRFPKLVQNQQDADSSAKPYVLSNTLVNSKFFSSLLIVTTFPVLSPSSFLIYMIYTQQERRQFSLDNRAGIN